MTTASLKLRATATAFALVLGSLASAPRAHAQDRMLAQATVPFDFQYGNAHMKAGQYRVKLTGTDLLTVQGRSSSAMSLVQWNEDRHPVQHGKLVFHRYGDTYVLREIWAPGESEHAGIQKSKSEKRLEEFSQNTSAPSDVEVALVEPSR